MYLGIKQASNATAMYKWFCGACFWRTGAWLSHVEARRLIEHGYVAEVLPETTYENLQYVKQHAEQEAAKKQEWTDRRAAYHEYLNSHEWALKRALVLERDNHLCQACLSSKANQVHHRSYEGIDSLIGQFKEPLFNLVSVCRPCHMQIHGGSLSDEEAT